MVPKRANYKVFPRERAYDVFQPSEDTLERIPNAGDLTPEEMASLRLIVRHSFMSKGAISTVHRTLLVEMGLISNAMGGVMPTSAGRICARG